MRTKVTLVLIFLNVALFFFIFKFERAWRTEAALQEARRRVLGSETADIRSIRVTSNLAAGPTYTLVRNRDLWTLTQPLDWPANQHAVHSIIQNLQLLENVASFNVNDLAKNGQSLADYGLDKPRMTLTFTSSDGSAPGADGRDGAGPTTVLQIGDTTNVGNLYILSPDGSRINVVKRALVDAISLPIEQLRADTLMTIEVFEAKALNVQTSGARVRIARREGKWLFDTIVNARASKTEMDLTINALKALHAGSFPTSLPSVLPSAAPTLRVTIDGNNRSETLLLGEPAKGGDGTGGQPATAQTEYYAQLMNGNVVRAPVFTVVVPTKLLERLRNAQNDLRERHILDFDAGSVTSITLAAPGLPAVTLQRLDTNSPDSAWQIVQRGDGTGGAQTVPADSAAVRRLLDRLTLLSADKFESDAPSSAQTESWGFNRPEREIALVVSAAPGSPVRPILLQLGTDSAGAVYARTGAPTELGPSVYAVTVDLAQDFPVDTKAWRDRMLKELPATARISAIKVTDLSNQQAVLDTALDPAGKPTGEVRDPAALKALLASLRSLRARRFVADGFPSKLMVGGDERTWRYQIDTTIALPGSNGEQASVVSLFVTDRIGGTLQLGGSKDLGMVFELEQPLVDALWAVTYGGRDPGPQPEKK